MATSGSFGFTVVRDDIIRMALLNIRKLDAAEAPNSVDLQDCARMLNLMVKQWMGKADYAPGLKIWTRKRGYLFLSSTTGQYLLGPNANGWCYSFVKPALTVNTAIGGNTVTLSNMVGVAATNVIGVIQADGSMFWTTILSILGSVVTLTAVLPAGANANATAFVYPALSVGQNPIKIETAILRDVANSDTPMRIIRDIADYDSISNKADPTNASDPAAIYHEFQLNNSNLFIDCGAAQDLTKYLVLTFLEPIQDFISPNDNPEYPQEWYLPLCLGLAKNIAPMYNKTWSPLQEENFKAAITIAQHKDPEYIVAFFQAGEDT